MVPFSSEIKMFMKKFLKNIECLRKNKHFMDLYSKSGYSLAMPAASDDHQRNHQDRQNPYR